MTPMAAMLKVLVVHVSNIASKQLDFTSINFAVRVGLVSKSSRVYNGCEET